MRRIVNKHHHLDLRIPEKVTGPHRSHGFLFSEPVQVLQVLSCWFFQQNSTGDAKFPQIFYNKGKSGNTEDYLGISGAAVPYAELVLVWKTTLGCFASSSSARWSRSDRTEVRECLSEGGEVNKKGIQRWMDSNAGSEWNMPCTLACGVSFCWRCSSAKLSQNTEL